MTQALKAKIKRASLSAQARTNQLDQRALNDLAQFYREAISAISLTLERYANEQGQLRSEVLGNVLAEARQILAALAQQQELTLFSSMHDAADIATSPFDEALEPSVINDAIQTSLRTVRDFVAEDGLQLSDRLWRINHHAKQVMESAISMAVLQGQSAEEAARNFVARGEPVPKEVQMRMQGAGVGAVGRVLAQELMAGAGTAYHNARRVFRTEINRAHIVTYRKSAFSVQGVVGTRFLLSPNHPEVDICDLHAKVNLYGLGPGVYPEGKSPLPAHPETRSYEISVFEDEITDADRAGKQTRLEFLASLPALHQAKILGSVNKQRALAAGLLRENQITTPWRTLKSRLGPKLEAHAAQ